MPLLGTHSSDGSGPSPVSKSLQDERRSLEEREGRTPGKESPFSLSLGSQPFHYSKTMPQMKNAAVKIMPQMTTRTSFVNKKKINSSKAAVSRVPATIFLKNALTDKFCSFIEAHRRSTDSPFHKLS